MKFYQISTLTSYINDEGHAQLSTTIVAIYSFFLQQCNIDTYKTKYSNKDTKKKKKEMKYIRQQYI